MSENISDINYKQVIEYALEPLIIHSDLKIIDINHAGELFFRASKKDIIGASPLDIFKNTSKSSIEKRIQSAYDQPAKVIEETIYRMDGTTVDVELYCHPVWLGDTKAIQTYIWDITDRKEMEKKQKEMSNQINELSSVLVPLLDGIAVLPLFGAIDDEKANQLLVNVPIRVKKQHVKYLIIDFTGIYNIDTIVVSSIFKITSVLSILGVRCIATGLRPELAMVVVQLDVNFVSIPTLSSVQEALKMLGIAGSSETLTF
ncbi:PAS domain S-box protein [Niallia taxi]|uniref:PAS domain S-box protein n=1 Tax=Niallia taxi TaxID=2499688 RepID=UPI002E1F6A71|nr:PAS domain S-box protein [Niallia taxi]